VISVVPAVRPVSTPPPVIVPTAGAELLQAPAGVALVSVMSLPVHTVDGPLIAPGVGFTDIVVVV
jgi:hypothetical protein